MRTRDLKPGFFRNEELARLHPYARLLYQGLWCMADKKGRLKDSIGLIRADVFPHEPKVRVETYLEELVQGGFIVRYDVDGVRCIWLPTFVKNQHPHPREPESALPPHPADADNTYLTSSNVKSDVSGDYTESPELVPENTRRANEDESESRNHKKPWNVRENTGRLHVITGSDPSNHFSAIPSNTLTTNAPTSNHQQVDEVAAAFARFGRVTSGTTDAINYAVKDFGIEWVEKAVRVAAGAGPSDKPPWGYVETILERWKHQGGPDEPRLQANGHTPRRSARTAPTVTDGSDYERYLAGEDQGRSS